MRDPYLESACAACKSANGFLGQLYRCGLWLSHDQCVQVAQHGLAFLKAYQECAQYAFNRQVTRFKLQPKYHAMIHLVDTYVRGANSFRRWTWNVLGDGTQMDEDFVGRISAISRAVSVKSAHDQTIARYLVSMWEPE